MRSWLELLRTLGHWLGVVLRWLAQCIDPQDPEMLSVRDLSKELSPDAAQYLDAKLERAWDSGATIG